jgi:AcrR family transcriptional regulator
LILFRSSPCPVAAPGLRERNKREKLARITAAARELFRAKGFEETTAREICERAGIGTGTLFLYVRDSASCCSCPSRPTRGACSRRARPSRAQRGLVAKLMCLFGRFTAYYAKDRALAKAIVQELFFRTHDPGGLGRLTREFAEHVAGLVAAAQARGEIRADLTPARAAMALFAHYAYWTLGAAGNAPRAASSPACAGALELQVEDWPQQQARRDDGDGGPA